MDQQETTKIKTASLSGAFAHTTGRYQIGQEIYTCAFIYENHADITRPLSYGDDTLPETVKFIKLTVMEHHKVSQPHSLEAECDGYILTSPEGDVFHNQYPIASYGQSSDLRNRVFTTSTKGMSKDQIRELVKNSKNKPWQYVTIDEVYTPINTAVNLVDTKIDEHTLYRFSKLLKMFNSAFEEQFPGKELSVVPYVFHNTDGTTETFQDILETRVVDKGCVVAQQKMTTQLTVCLFLIKELRLGSGVTQKSMAKKLGISASTYSKTEAADIPLTFNRFVGMCEVLGFKPSEVVKVAEQIGIWLSLRGWLILRDIPEKGNDDLLELFRSVKTTVGADIDASMKEILEIYSVQAASLCLVFRTTKV